MNLHTLPKLNARSTKRLGRGIGSGRGKTAGRGTKGQKARGKVPQGFIGETLSLYKKLPFRRGLGNRVVSIKPMPIQLGRLDEFKPKTVIEIATLVEAGLVTETHAVKRGVKIVGNSPLKVALTVKVPTSKGAREAITKAGGTVE